MHGIKSAILATFQKLADWLDWPCPVCTGWRTLVESEFSWKLFFKMRVFQWKFSKDEFLWTFFTNSRGHFLSTRIHPSKGIFVDILSTKIHPKNFHENSPKQFPLEFTQNVIQVFSWKHNIWMVTIHTFRINIMAGQMLVF